MNNYHYVRNTRPHALLALSRLLAQGIAAAGGS
jgi:hypothetical protein